jgi:hypothetical protein
MLEENILSMNSIVSAVGGQLSAGLEGETVILHLASGTYFGLGAVGARIWELIEKPTSIGDVRDALLEEYDVEAARCERDVLALLGDLEAHHLIEVHPRLESDESLPTAFPANP